MSTDTLIRPIDDYDDTDKGISFCRDENEIPKLVIKLVGEPKIGSAKRAEQRERTYPKKEQLPSESRVYRRLVAGYNHRNPKKKGISPDLLPEGRTDFRGRPVVEVIRSSHDDEDTIFFDASESVNLLDLGLSMDGEVLALSAVEAGIEPMEGHLHSGSYLDILASKDGREFMVRTSVNSPYIPPSIKRNPSRTRSYLQNYYQSKPRNSMHNVRTQELDLISITTDEGTFYASEEPVDMEEIDEPNNHYDESLDSYEGMSISNQRLSMREAEKSFRFKILVQQLLDRGYRHSEAREMARLRIQDSIALGRTACRRPTHSTEATRRTAEDYHGVVVGDTAQAQITQDIVGNL